MRIRKSLLIAAALTGVLPACTPPQQEAAPKQAEPAALVRSSGVVFAITREYNAVTIQHEPIPEYEMDAMVMEFTVDEPAQLDGIEVGDQVSFVLRSGLDIQTITVVEAEDSAP